MPDREKVIKGLEWSLKTSCVEETGVLVPQDTLNNVLALLKAREPRAVHVTAEINYRKVGDCPNCGKPINSGDYPNYCGRCGQAVKWDA